jgi:hypothetical protein
MLSFLFQSIHCTQLQLWSIANRYRCIRVSEERLTASLLSGSLSIQRRSHVAQCPKIPPLLALLALLADGRPEIEIAFSHYKVSCSPLVLTYLSSESKAPLRSRLLLSDIHVCDPILLVRIRGRSLSRLATEATGLHSASWSASRSTDWASTTHAFHGLRSGIPRVVQNIRSVVHELKRKVRKLTIFSGPVMHLKVLGRSMIILDSYQAAVELLENRGVTYSDRPKFTLYEL